MTFEKRRVGQTDVMTTHVGFGCGGIGNLYEHVSDEDAQALLEYAWSNGVRYFDTAPHYGRGRSETRLGAFLERCPRDEVVVSTKVGRVLSPGAKRNRVDGFVDPLPNDVRYDYSGDGIAESFRGSCERLGVDRVDIVFVHDIGTYTHGEANETHLEALLATGLPALRELKEAGRIGAIGLGVNENEICVDILKRFPLDVILLAGRWTLLDRSAETELVPLCRERGTSLVLGGIFNSGILATGPKPGAYFDYEPASQAVLDKVEALQVRCEASGLTLADAAIQFAMTRDLAASVLTGTGKLSSLERNIHAMHQFALPQD